MAKLCFFSKILKLFLKINFQSFRKINRIFILNKKAVFLQP